MTLPRQIPAGARVVVRITDGIDPVDHRMKFRDYVCLLYTSDAADEL